MRIEHIALWTNDIERCTDFYVHYFGASAGSGYENRDKDSSLAFSVSPTAHASKS